MIKKRFLLILFLCLLIFIPIVSAETLTGSIGSSGTSSVNYNTTSNAAGYGTPYPDVAGISFKNIQYSGTPLAVVMWAKSGSGYGVVYFGQANPYAGEATQFTAYQATSSNYNTNIGGARGTGTIGYQRIFNAQGTEVQGYIYVVFNSLNTTGLTGDTHFNLSYNHNDLHQLRYRDVTNSGLSEPNVANGYPLIGGNYWGYYTFNKDIGFSQDYTVTKYPSGTIPLISGYVLKNGINSREFVYDQYDAIQISESTLNTNRFNFTSNSEQVKISAMDSLGQVFNTSLLFSPAIPTITPTPTPTPNILGESNVTIIVRDNTNSTLLSNAMVQIKRHDSHNTIDTDYTDTNGIANFAIIDISEYPQQEFVVSKAGYQTVNNWLTISPYSYTQTIYLNPNVPGQEDQNPYPDWINVTLFVKSTNGNQPVSNAYVAIYDSQAQITGQAGYTNATGGITFRNFANTPYIEGYVTANGYVKKYWNKYPIGEQSLTDYTATIPIVPLSQQTVVPTPTPTPVTYDTLGLTASPNTISLGQTVSLTGTSSNATRLTYAGGLRRTIFMVNKHAQAYPFDFQEIGMFENVNATYWKFRSSYASSWGTPSTASPLSMTNVPDTNGIYTYAFIGYETIAGGSGAIAQAGTADVTVNGGSGAGSLTMNLFAYDGSNTNHLSNYQMNITDDNSGTVSELGNISYDINRNLPRGNSYTLRASKENYETGVKQFIVPISPDIEAGDFGAMIGVPLFPTGTISAGNTTVTVHVTDIETYYPIGNVQIQMSVDGSSKYTGSDGESAYWILPQNTAYTVKAIKSGYCSVTESKNTGTNTYQYVPLFMKYGTCTGTTPTPTPTITPSVTVTPIWNGTPNEGVLVCGQLPQDATMIDVLKNSLACNGLKDQASQNLGMACLIILFCAIVLGRIAKGVGVLSGVIAGTVLATVAGFLPFWIIIVVVIMAGLIFAAKVFWAPGG